MARWGPVDYDGRLSWRSGGPIFNMGCHPVPIVRGGLLTASATVATPPSDFHRSIRIISEKARSMRPYLTLRHANGGNDGRARSSS